MFMVVLQSTMKKLSDATDAASSDSTSQSLMEVIHGETMRRKKKALHMRENSDHGSVHSASSRRKKIHPGGIMAVRTLEESLVTSGLSGRRNKYKLKRRALKRALHGSTNSLDSFSIQASESSLSCSIESPASVITGNGNLNHSVSFNKVIIREYPQIPGVNPSVSRGCPLTIGWDYVEECTYDIDKFEGARVRRDTIQMRMPPDYRTKLLRGHGHSWKTIQKCTKDANIARRKRQKTYERLDSQQFDEGMEKLVRAFKKTFKNRSHKNKLKTESLKKSSAFDDEKGTSSSQSKSNSKTNKERASLEPKETHDLNTSRSRSASHFDLTLGAGEDDYELGSDDECFLEDGDGDMMSDEEDLKVPSTVMTGSKVDPSPALKVSATNRDSIRSTRTPATVIIQGFDECSVSNPLSSPWLDSLSNSNGISPIVVEENSGHYNVDDSASEEELKYCCDPPLPLPSGIFRRKKTSDITTNVI